MLHILGLMLFAGVAAAAIIIMAVTVAAYKDKMIAALRMQPLSNRPAPWRTPPRRAPRSGSPRIVWRVGLNRAAA